MIRRDIWSVKVWDFSIGAWCHERMFRASHLAFKWVKNSRQPNIEYKIVHPADWIVDAFVALGNTIDGVKVTNFV